MPHSTSGEDRSPPPGRGSILEALRSGEPERAAGMGTVLAAEAVPRPGEEESRARVRALQLAIEIAEAAAEGGVPRERADAGVLRAAGGIAGASRPADVAAALERLLQALVAVPAPPESSAAHLARRAAAYVLRSFRQNLTLEDVARHVRLSPAYFSALFKREQGVGFTRFLREVRLAEARRLLRETDQTVEQVANAVGYEDAHYFSRVFSREMGIPPARYRNQQQREREQE